jgi:arylsulfatase A-like enzyme
VTTYVPQPKIGLLKTRFRKFLLIVIAALSGQAASVVAAVPAANTRHVVLIVWDGMRPDFVTEKYAPALNKLAHDGVRFRNHHAVYPTATDVNGAALATGCYPDKNGIAANLEYRPKINPRQPVDISDPEAIKRGDEVTGGKHLLVPTFPELLRAAGKKVALVGTKSVAVLFDRHNDWTIVPMRNKALTIFAGAPINAAQRGDLTKLLGPFADAPGATAKQRNDFATRALTEFLWRDGVPDFSLLWLSEPDLSEHNYAPGSPQAIAAIKNVDDDLALLLKALDQKHARDTTDVLVVSDHGFSTIRRSIDVVALLNAAGFRAFKEFSETPRSGDILVVGNAGTVLFYVQQHDRSVTQRLVDWLQHSDFTDLIFTRETLDGTFPLNTIRIGTDDSPDVVAAFRWSDEKNQFGVAGMIDADWNRKAGEGTHATFSSHDIYNVLIAYGPDFQSDFVDGARSANIDLAPTILFALATKPAQKFSGRILAEALAEKANAGSFVPQKTESFELKASRDLGKDHWQQTLSILTYDDRVQYYDERFKEFEKQ